MTEAFALQKLLTYFFNEKYWQNLNINIWKFNETLTNDIVSFEQPGPGWHTLLKKPWIKIDGVSIGINLVDRDDKDKDNRIQIISYFGYTT